MPEHLPDLGAGDRWLRSRSPIERKRLGQWVTPWWVVDAVARRACADLPAGAVVVDPACGDGRWLLAVGRARPDARLIGIDVDPAAVHAAGLTLDAAGIVAEL